MDSFHECLQEYGEGLEVVQICLEPEEVSIKDEELSALGDLSYDDCNKDGNVKENDEVKIDIAKVNGVKSSKSEESIDQDDDMTITEDDILMPRELQREGARSKSADRKEDGNCLSKLQSKDVSTSDEMVFAVTPTGLERISFDKYWKDYDGVIEKPEIEKVKNDDSSTECLNSPEDTSYYDANAKISVHEENSLLYIDHEIDGYETCLDDDSTSLKCTVKNGRKINGEREIKATGKQNKTSFRNKDIDVSAKTVNSQNVGNVVNDVSCCLQAQQEEQMDSPRRELNSSIKSRSPTKPSNERAQCVVYYNDQDECLKEIRRRKLEEEEKKHKAEQRKMLEHNLAATEKKLKFRKQEVSEESTDLENNYVPGCHKCFLENYAYAITKAYIAKANACKYCEVIRDMLEPSKTIPERRMSAPASINLESSGSESDDEDLLLVPVVKGRRKSAGPLKFLLPSRRPSDNRRYAW